MRPLVAMCPRHPVRDEPQLNPVCPMSACLQSKKPRIRGRRSRSLRPRSHAPALWRALRPRARNHTRHSNQTHVHNDIRRLNLALASARPHTASAARNTKRGHPPSSSLDCLHLARKAETRRTRGGDSTPARPLPCCLPGHEIRAIMTGSPDPYTPFPR